MCRLCVVLLLVSAIATPVVSYGADAEFWVWDRTLTIPVVAALDNLGQEEGGPAPRNFLGAYSVKMALDSSGSYFLVTALIPIPDFAYKVDQLSLGMSRQSVTEVLGPPSSVRTLGKCAMALGPAPVNLTEGTPYEEWEYTVDGIVYLIWFAATSNVPLESWLLQGTASFSGGAIF